MMGLKFFAAAISVYRSFSTKTGSKTKKYAQSSYNYRNKYKKKTNEPKIKLTQEQQDVLNYVRCGFSVFITGSAGTGKTILLKRIINFLRDRHGSSGVYVTASTGVAACALNGITVHSFAGFGSSISGLDRETLLERVEMSSRACKSWRNVKALILDECSLIDANMFENLEFIARQIRKSKKLWGGIQLIVSGDFLQLPPVPDKNNKSGKEFAFEADCWNESFGVQVELTEVKRQSDPKFIKLLQGIRKGVINPEDLKLLEQCCQNSSPDLSAVQLYPRVEDVDRVNEEKMKSLGEKVVVYNAVNGGKNPWRAEFKQGIVPDQLELCKGARVVLIKNLNSWDKLFNGSTGTVIRFTKPKDDEDLIKLSPDNILPVVKFDSGKEMVIKPQMWEILEGADLVAWRCQIPLRLAWALSIHKCQGMTLDCLHTNLSRSFGYGMVYVAISRVTTLEGLHLSGFDPSMIKAHPKVLRFYESLAVKNCTIDEDVDDVAHDKGGSSSNNKIPGHTDKASIGGIKCHFSLSEFLLSRQRRK